MAFVNEPEPAGSVVQVLAGIGVLRSAWFAVSIVSWLEAFAKLPFTVPVTLVAHVALRVMLQLMLLSEPLVTPEPSVRAVALSTDVLVQLTVTGTLPGTVQPVNVGETSELIVSGRAPELFARVEFAVELVQLTVAVVLAEVVIVS
ncbi:hypothetical protein [Conexibacter woesei]|uniref:hypothetical protein n=1 Tax=Conexibacter woesei TaxID=191495 RepID=UPI0003FCCFFD|nr:hypothetical protein [Conexibacter woesei]